MLEISHVSKIYKNRKGQNVIALDDISLKFPETGMIFLLGKSGSGKSTLLNVSGGLDNPTCGEIIIKGKSSKDFTQSDFDSYRNTYVGFIFQEFNILEEFSVYDNIALALELQNKEVNYDEIIELLKKVDLDGFENRKPNTLSGGQKQRIAIARALIKNPLIIMADEPSGSLDSTTGKQVFDTLKKLSKDKLVLVVSHDREFAEEYADRIIELKDGKLISDNTKVIENKDTSVFNLAFKKNTLWVNSGKELNDVDFRRIREFIESSDKVLISKSEKDIIELKKITHEIDGFETESFRKTDESKIEIKEYDKDKNIFIKSRLPLKHAFKIGVSSLFIKPFRLLFTIFLCSVAFLLFGLLSTLTFYDNENSFKETLKNTDMKYMVFGKSFPVKEIYGFGDEEYTFDYEQKTSFNEEDYKLIKNKYGKDVFYGLNYHTMLPIQRKENAYYFTFFSSYAYIEEDNKIHSDIVGEYPQNNNEILLSSYIVDCLKFYDVLDANNNQVKINERKDIIGKKYIFNDKTYKVTGYFESGEIDSKFDELKISDKNNYLTTEYFSYLSDSIHLIVFVSNDELQNLSYISDMYNSINLSYSNAEVAVIKNKDENDFDENYNVIYKKNNDLTKILKKGEVFVSPSIYAKLVLEKYGHNSEIYQKALNIQNGGEYINDDFIEYTYIEIIEKSHELYEFVNEEFEFDMKLFSYDKNESFGDIYSYKIKGIYDNYLGEFIIMNKEDFSSLWNIHRKNMESFNFYEYEYNDIVSEYQKIYVPFNKSNKEINEYWDIYDNKTYDKDGDKFVIMGHYIDVLEYIDTLVKEFYQFFLYGGIFLGIFALLMLSNFISISISNKTKEIGILRAVGARSLDVFKIFFSESLIIMILCLLLSIFMCFRICNYLNMNLASELRISVFVFGVISFFVILSLSIITTFIATYIPVRKESKKKPVESIRAL